MEKLVVIVCDPSKLTSTSEFIAMNEKVKASYRGYKYELTFIVPISAFKVAHYFTLK